MGPSSMALASAARCVSFNRKAWPGAFLSIEHRPVIRLMALNVSDSRIFDSSATLVHGSYFSKTLLLSSMISSSPRRTSPWTTSVLAPSSRPSWTDIGVGVPLRRIQSRDQPSGGLLGPPAMFGAATGPLEPDPKGYCARAGCMIPEIPKRFTNGSRGVIRAI